MPGLNSSKWATKPAHSARSSVSTAKNASKNMEEYVYDPFRLIQELTQDSRHPVVGTSNRSSDNTNTNNVKLTPLTPGQAEDTAQKVVERMTELQDNSGPVSNGTLHDQNGTGKPLASRPVLSLAVPAGPPISIETAQEKEARLYKLFNQWVPRGHEFHSKYQTLELNQEDIRAVLDEIVDYQVKTALAAAWEDTYRPVWRTVPQEVAVSTVEAEARVNTDAELERDADDLLGLGLKISSAKGGMKDGGGIDLLD